MPEIAFIMGKSASGKDKIYKNLIEDESLKLNTVILYYDRFLSALKEIDKSWKVESKDSEFAVGESLGYAINNKPEVCMCPADAIDLMDENGYEDLSVNSPDICGRISMSSVLIYPPGMPVVNVGERITGDVCRIIKSAINAGLEVPGLKEGKIRCLR